MVVGLPMPKPSDGAKPHPFCVTSSRPATPASCHIALRRSAVETPRRRLRSTVPRLYEALPPVRRMSPAFMSIADFVTRLIAPPVAPRPAVTDDGPFDTSTASVLKV